MPKQVTGCGGSPGKPAWRTIFADHVAVANGLCVGCHDCKPKSKAG